MRGGDSGARVLFRGTALIAVLLSPLLLSALGCGEGPAAAGVSEAGDPPPGVPTMGIWIGRQELASLSTAGKAWRSLRAAAEEECGTPRLSDQERRTNVCVLAKALVYARTGWEPGQREVAEAIERLTAAGPYRGRALALGRQLAAYVIAADLIDLAGYDPALDRAFREKLRVLRTAPTREGPDDLVKCHEVRPNNWGTHCGASRAAIAAYLGEEEALERVAQVFRGYLGERASYAGFEYGEVWWQCHPERPVGVNPAGCTREGHPIGGVLPDDQRRGGSFAWPPPKVNYVWEALQGALVQAMILRRQGYPAFRWGDRALLRAVRWLHDQAGYPAEGDDTWQPHLVNFVYGTGFPAPVPASPGKNMGWTDWTHGPRRDRATDRSVRGDDPRRFLPVNPMTDKYLSGLPDRSTELVWGVRPDAAGGK